MGARSRSAIASLGTWVTAAALAIDLLLIVILLALVAWHGASAFWPRPLVAFELRDGTRRLGEVQEREEIPDLATGRHTGAMRTRLRVGNRDLGGADFAWIDDAQIAARDMPRGAVALERLEWGPFYGYPVELRVGERVVASDPAAIWAAFPALHREKLALRERLRSLEKGTIGDLNHDLEQLRLAGRRLEITPPPEPERSRRAAELAAQKAALEGRYQAEVAKLEVLHSELASGELVMAAADGTRRSIPIGGIVRASRPNELGLAGKLRLYAARIAEFVGGEPREANTEGGIFPALFGTVMMVFLMSIFVVPFGVLAAIFLQEYAREGWAVRAARIAVNNLAGVPSIVFGVFGLGFFVYGIGGALDRLFFSDALPSPTFGTGGILWASATLALLTVPVVIVATEEGLAAVPQGVRQGSRALGATQLETLLRVVLPAAAPGVLTGLILAMARAAGEVAPLMIVGMVKLAPALPVDHHPPFLHLERKFMHLGFHIYDTGFQSPNVEAAVPLVFTTTALLIAIVVTLNLTAILLRNRLRQRLAGRGL
jgi:phosphate transport system permease protein